MCCSNGPEILVEQAPESHTFVRSLLRRLHCHIEFEASEGTPCLQRSILLPIPAEEVVSVVVRLPTKLGALLVHFSEVLVISVDVQKDPVDTAEWHEVRFVLVILAIAESLVSGADRAVLWTVAMTPVIEPA